ncbi:hypothetical protein VOLCADRAFT_98368 [Volvox carteri f. nagariensis]|uniref:Uncharacterized protein n=1 Tax=Volvox carteri f. nagariensis TaxID=3068 RepID=D8UF59_VOLCA|nr:uncharacterized protein VOLCADRAFT_98368 [Volvox carteri f. nagariensis]EFJ41624.1 hypothetical protein VOLCADRAFT_98368 [Volvox carteri f. nagariensis]|eukprot:XP_002957280.1 hypothetical protein VOLCADRAFT_98368 [Volvox carteri f. nagariensis]
MRAVCARGPYTRYGYGARGGGETQREGVECSDIEDIESSYQGIRSHASTGMDTDVREPPHVIFIQIRRQVRVRLVKRLEQMADLGGYDSSPVRIVSMSSFALLLDASPGKAGLEVCEDGETVRVAHRDSRPSLRGASPYGTEESPTEEVHPTYRLSRAFTGGTPGAAPFLAEGPLRTWLSDGFHTSIACLGLISTRGAGSQSESTRSPKALPRRPAGPTATSPSRRSTSSTIASSAPALAAEDTLHAALEVLLGLQRPSVLLECLHAAFSGPAATGGGLALWCKELHEAANSRGASGGAQDSGSGSSMNTFVGSSDYGKDGGRSSRSSSRGRGASGGGGTGSAQRRSNTAATAAAGTATAQAGGGDGGASWRDLMAEAVTEAMADFSLDSASGVKAAAGPRGGGARHMSAGFSGPARASTATCTSGATRGSASGGAAAMPSSSCVHAASVAEAIAALHAAFCRSSLWRRRDPSRHLRPPAEAAATADGTRVGTAATSAAAAPSPGSLLEPAVPPEGPAAVQLFVRLGVRLNNMSSQGHRNEPQQEQLGRAAGSARAGAAAHGGRKQPPDGVWTTIDLVFLGCGGSAPRPLQSTGPGAQGSELCRQLAPLLAGNVAPHLLVVLPASLSPDDEAEPGREECAVLGTLKLISEARAIRTVVTKSEPPPPLLGSSGAGGSGRAATAASRPVSASLPEPLAAAAAAAAAVAASPCDRDRQVASLLRLRHSQEMKDVVQAYNRAAAAAAAAAVTTVPVPEPLIPGAGDFWEPQDSEDGSVLGLGRHHGTAISDTNSARIRASSGSLGRTGTSAGIGGGGGGGGGSGAAAATAGFRSSEGGWLDDLAADTIGAASPIAAAGPAASRQTGSGASLLDLRRSEELPWRQVPLPLPSPSQSWSPSQFAADAVFAAGSGSRSGGLVDKADDAVTSRRTAPAAAAVPGRLLFSRHALDLHAAGRDLLTSRGSHPAGRVQVERHVDDAGDGGGGRGGDAGTSYTGGGAAAAAMPRRCGAGPEAGTGRTRMGRMQRRLEELQNARLQREKAAAAVAAVPLARAGPLAAAAAASRYAHVKGSASHGSSSSAVANDSDSSGRSRSTHGSAGAAAAAAVRQPQPSSPHVPCTDALTYNTCLAQSRSTDVPPTQAGPPENKLQPPQQCQQRQQQQCPQRQGGSGLGHQGLLRSAPSASPVASPAAAAAFPTPAATVTLAEERLARLRSEFARLYSNLVSEVLQDTAATTSASASTAAAATATTATVTAAVGAVGLGLSCNSRSPVAAAPPPLPVPVPPPPLRQQGHPSISPAGLQPPATAAAATTSFASSSPANNDVAVVPEPFSPHAGGGGNGGAKSSSPSANPGGCGSSEQRPLPYHAAGSPRQTSPSAPARHPSAESLSRPFGEVAWAALQQKGPAPGLYGALLAGFAIENQRELASAEPSRSPSPAGGAADVMNLPGARASVGRENVVRYDDNGVDVSTDRAGSHMRNGGGGAREPSLSCTKSPDSIKRGAVQYGNESETLLTPATAVACSGGGGGGIESAGSGVGGGGSSPSPSPSSTRGLEHLLDSSSSSSDSCGGGGTGGGVETPANQVAAGAEASGSDSDGGCNPLEGEDSGGSGDASLGSWNPRVARDAVAVAAALVNKSSSSSPPPSLHSPAAAVAAAAPGAGVPTMQGSLAEAPAATLSPTAGTSGLGTGTIVTAAGSGALQDRLYETQLELMELRAAMEIQQVSHTAEVSRLRRHLRRAAVSEAELEDMAIAASVASPAAAAALTVTAAGESYTVQRSVAAPAPASMALDALIMAYDEEIDELQRQVAVLTAGQRELALQCAEQELADMARDARYSDQRDLLRGGGGGSSHVDPAPAGSMAAASARNGRVAEGVAAATATDVPSVPRRRKTSASPPRPGASGRSAATASPTSASAWWSPQLQPQARQHQHQHQQQRQPPRGRQLARESPSTAPDAGARRRRRHSCGPYLGGVPPSSSPRSPFSGSPQRPAAAPEPPFYSRRLLHRSAHGGGRHGQLQMSSCSRDGSPMRRKREDCSNDGLGAEGEREGEEDWGWLMQGRTTRSRPGTAGGGGAVGLVEVAVEAEAVWQQGRKEMGALRSALRQAHRREKQLREGLAAAQRQRRTALLEARVAAGERTRRQWLEAQVTGLTNQLAAARTAVQDAAAARDSAAREVVQLRTANRVMAAQLEDVRRLNESLLVQLTTRTAGRVVQQQQHYSDDVDPEPLVPAARYLSTTVA